MNSYLIIKLGAIGDVAMATAMLSEIRKTDPAASVTWVVGQAARPLLESTGLVDEIICTDENAILHGTMTQKIRTVWSVLTRLAGRRFDVCLVPYRDRRYRLLHLGVRCNEVRTFQQMRRLIPGRYHGFEYAALVHNKDLDPEARISLASVAVAPRQTQQTVPSVLLAPGSPDPHTTDWMRQWPLDFYARLAQMLCERGYSVGIVGMDKTGRVEEAFRDLPVVSFINRTTLSDMLQILGQARLLVTHDAGPLHLMELCRGACVALFGPTLASEKLFPADRNTALQSPLPLPCMPCYDGKNYAACSNHICMSNITPARVFQAVLSSLEKSADSGNAGEKP